MIDVSNLVFEYPGKRVLHNLSFQIQPQRICALVGPNGAGKTTLLRCIAALDSPLMGEISVDGVNVHQHPRESHQRIGYLADFFGLYEQLTVEQSLRYMAAAYRIDKQEQATAIDWVINKLNLENYRHERADALSRGTRQRLGIAQAILHKPKLVILDEPASGLDPEARHSLSELMLTLRDSGMTLLVSSHILAELEQYSDEMLIIRDGRIVQHHQLTQTTQETSAQTVVVKSSTPAHSLSEFINSLDNCSEVNVEEQRLTFTLRPGQYELDKALHLILRQLIRAGFEISEFYVEKHSLQDAYIRTLKTQKETTMGAGQ